MTDLVIQQGSTFQKVVRWESLPFQYAAISAITKAAPCVVTAASHGLQDGWRAAVVSALGMRQINAKRIPPRSSELHAITYVSATQVSFNDVDSSKYSTYTSGGFLVSYTPVSLVGFTARMQIRATVESTTTLDSLTSAAGDIVLDDAAHTITITIPATDTDDYDFRSAVYDLELVSAGGVVTRLAEGNVILSNEVTR